MMEKIALIIIALQHHILSKFTEGYNDIFIEDNELSEIKVYPNPTNGKLYYNFEEDQKNINISLMDLSGKEIAIKADYMNNMIEIPTYINNGMYILSFQTDDKLVSKLIVLER